jgi:DNA-binding beta-propeller fold protein YncE
MLNIMKRLLLLVFLIPLFVNAQPAWNLNPLDFFKIPEGKNFGETMGVAVNSRQHVFVFHRGPGSLMEFDENGSFVKTIGEGLFKKPHGLRVDRHDNIWITDVELHVAMRFNPAGQLTLILGKAGIAGEWDKTYNIALFDRPADVAFDSNDNIYVADGYGNSRVVKFDKDGNFVKTWGAKGNETGQFNLVHNVVVDSKNTVYVIDRENKRIQVFTTEGEYLRSWENIGDPFGIAILNDEFFITDGKEGSISKLGISGNVIAKYGKSGKATGQFLMPHAIAVDPDKKIFVAEAINWRVQSFRIQ